jgi:hypothetical protein
MVPPMHRAAVVKQSWVGMSSALAQAVLCKACIPPPDVHTVPTCRGLNSNNLSGTLPKEWSAMTALERL